eukprot:5016027-Amphidinium_carterae.1
MVVMKPNTTRQCTCRMDYNLACFAVLEAQINAVIGEEVKYTISMPGSAKCLNNLLEVRRGPSLVISIGGTTRQVGSTLRGQGPLKD